MLIDKVRELDSNTMAHRFVLKSGERLSLGEMAQALIRLEEVAEKYELTDNPAFAAVIRKAMESTEQE